MSWAAVVGFGVAVLPICLTPGVSFTLTTGRVLMHGRMAGLRVALGTALGLVCHAMLAAVGLAALVMRSSEAFTAVKLVGAVYLLWLGVSLLRAGGGDGSARQLPWGGHGDVVQGFLGNVLNPKAAAVYLTLAPQFLHRGAPVLPQMATLVAAHIVVAVGWLTLWSCFVGTARSWFTRRRTRTLNRASGTVLVGLGVRAAVTR